MKSLIVLVALVAVVLAQRCCMPDQFEGFRFDFDEKHHFRAGTNVSFDFTNSRARVVFHDRIGDSRVQARETLALFASNTLYEIDWIRRNCTKYTLTEKMEKDCVPHHARLEATHTIGGLIPCHTWGYDVVNQDGVIIHVLTTRVASSCFGVYGAQFNDRIGVDVDFVWDETPGIKNGNVFNPPKICTDQLATIGDQSRIPTLLHDIYTIPRGF